MKRRIAAGDFLVGVLPGQASADLVELCGLLGFDFVFIDAEHGVFDLETCRDMVRAADAVDMPALVRVPQNAPAAMLPYLEMGAAGVIVPHVCDASEAEGAVRAIKYGPRGARGSSTSSRAAGYGLTQRAAEYYAAANERTVVIPMIEEPRAIEQVASIGKVDGVDLVFVGPGDLALAMGYPGEPEHPEVRAAVARGFRAARTNGIRIGTVGYSASAAEEAVAMGAQLVIHATNALLGSAARDYLATMRSLPRGSASASGSE